MSFLDRFFKKETPPPAPPPSAGPFFLVDYAELAPAQNPPPPGGIYGMLHIDFKHVFPQVLWASGTIFRPENPSGFSLKVLSARHEPSGDIECVYIQQMFDGGKIVIRRFMVAAADFDAVENLVRDLESQHSTNFRRIDFSSARTSPEFRKLITGHQPPPLPSSQPPRLQ